MKTIKCVVDAIENNIDEARQHILHAYELMHDDRQIADWFRDMAEQHLKFNINGHTVGERAIETFKAIDSEKQLMPGMVAVYNAKHADLMRQTAQVRYLIDNYGK